MWCMAQKSSSTTWKVCANLTWGLEPLSVLAALNIRLRPKYGERRWMKTGGSSQSNLNKHPCHRLNAQAFA